MQKKHVFQPLIVSLLLVATSASMCAGEKPAPAPGKLHHIGLIWLKNPGNEDDRQKIVAAVHRFAREIPEVREVKVGGPAEAISDTIDTSFDVCFVMALDDEEALKRYSAHPVHAEEAERVFLPLAEKFLFYDFKGQ